MPFTRHRKEEGSREDNTLEDQRWGNELDNTQRNRNKGPRPRLLFPQDAYKKISLRWPCDWRGSFWYHLLTEKNLRLQKCHKANLKNKVPGSVLSVFFYDYLQIFQAGLCLYVYILTSFTFPCLLISHLANQSSSTKQTS